MRKRLLWTKGAAAFMAACLVFQVTGCRKSTEVGLGMTEESTAGTEVETKAAESGEASAGGSLEAAGGISASYDEDDLNAEWSEEEASAVIACSGKEAEIQGSGISEENGVLTVNAAGTYVFRGDYEGQILVDAGKDDVVRLVFDGFSISHVTSSPVYGLQCGKLILTLAGGTENTVSDGTLYVFDSEEDDEPDAAIFSKDDLTINGTGSLTVEGNYSNGIRSKDDLRIVSGTIRVTAENDAIKGKDALMIRDGEITAVSGQDGLKSNNDSDPDKGYVVIDGGVISVTAGNDGIHGETWLTINGGTIDVTESYEGLEAMKIDINGGIISVNATDDGINAAAVSTGDEQEDERAKMEANPDVYVRISGGEITVNSGADGIDSNGNLYVTGGTTHINGPESGGDGALDYNGTAEISGGVFAAVGSSRMMQSFSSDSEQKMIYVFYEEGKEAGTSISLADADGNEAFSWTPEKTYECLLLSLPEFADGDVYRLVTGEEETELTIDGTITKSGQENGGFQGRGGRGAGGGRVDGAEGRPEGEMGEPGAFERPEGEAGEPGAFEKPEGEAGDPSIFEKPEGEVGAPGAFERPEGETGAPRAFEKPDSESGAPEAGTNGPERPEKPGRGDRMPSIDGESQQPPESEAASGGAEDV